MSTLDLDLDATLKDARAHDLQVNGCKLLFYVEQLVARVRELEAQMRRRDALCAPVSEEEYSIR